MEVFLQGFHGLNGRPRASSAPVAGSKPRMMRRVTSQLWQTTSDTSFMSAAATPFKMSRSPGADTRRCVTVTARVASFVVIVCETSAGRRKSVRFVANFQSFWAFGQRATAAREPFTQSWLNHTLPSAAPGTSNRQSRPCASRVSVPPLSVQVPEKTGEEDPSGS